MYCSTMMHVDEHNSIMPLLRNCKVALPGAALLGEGSTTCSAAFSSCLSRASLNLFSGARAALCCFLYCTIRHFPFPMLLPPDDRLNLCCFGPYSHQCHGLMPLFQMKQKTSPQQNCLISIMVLLSSQHQNISTVARQQMNG